MNRVKGLNIKGLCKQIKATKSRLMWSHNNNEHFISNGHWAITLADLPLEVKIALLQTFEGETPHEGMCLNKQYDVILTPPCPKPIELKCGVACEWTNYYMDFHDGLARIFKNGENVSFVNRDNLLAIEYGTPVVHHGKNKPIEFPDIRYIVMPIRVESYTGLLDIMKAMGD